MQSPEPPAMSQGSAQANQDDADWEAAVGGSKAHYYLPRFAKIKQGLSGGWHWPAALFTFYWLLYRKLWGVAILYLIGSYLFMWLSAAAVGAMGGENSPFAGPIWLLVLIGVLYGVPGMKANSWLYGRSEKIIGQARQMGGTREQQLARIASRGGTSNVPLVIIGFLVFLSFMGALASILLSNR